MTSAVDTNVLVALWVPDDGFNRDAQVALDKALAQGNLVVSATAYSELLAFPTRTDGLLQAFFRETGIAVDWNLSESVWKAAGRDFGVYAARACDVVNRGCGECWWTL